MAETRLAYVGAIAVATVFVNAGLWWGLLAFGGAVENAASYLGAGIGISQMLWVAPVHLLARRRHPDLAAGVLWGGALTALLSGLCYGSVVYVLFTAHL